MSSLDRLPRVLRDPAVSYALKVFGGVWLGMLALTILIKVIGPQPPPPDPYLRPYFGVMPQNGLLGMWQRWDTLSFQRVAEVGFMDPNLGPIIPPLYPLLMRGLGTLLGGNTLLAGLIIANAAYLAALIYFFKLVLLEFDLSTARRATLYLAIFPTAFFYLAAYTESLFLLCTVAGFYHARKGQWWAAGVWGFLAPLVRLQGAFLLLPLIFEYLRQKRRLGWDSLALLLAALGNLIFPLFVWLSLGLTPWTPFSIHTQRFHGRFAPPWASLLAAVRVLGSGQFFQADIFDFAFALLFLVLLVGIAKTLPPVYTLYSAIMLLAILSKVGPISPLLSTGRYVLPIFPAFVLLGRWASTPWRQRSVVYPSVALLIFFAGQFILWGWVA
jgi:hypothetical protein